MLVFSPLIFTQDGGGGSSGFSIGIKGGGIRSTMRTDYQFKFAEHRYGPVGGLSLGYRFSDLFGLQTDVLYTQEGASCVPAEYLYVEPSVYGSSDQIYLQRLNSNVVLHNVEVPLQFNFSYSFRVFLYCI
jgi:hypothetical protein